MSARPSSRLLLGLLFLACSTHRAGPPPPPPLTRTLGGQVRSEDGAPVAGARVAAIPVQPIFEWTRAQVLETTDAGGHFQFALAPGRYIVSATAPGQTAGGSGPVSLEATGEPPALDVKLGGEGFLLSGTVFAPDGRPAPDVQVRAIPHDDEQTGALHVRTDAQGRYAVKLRPGKHDVVADAPGTWMRDQGVRLLADARLDLRLRSQVLPASTEQQLVTWVREHAVPVTLEAPGSDVAALEALRSVIGDARVVGLGESTHGTREFFLFRHQLFEFLVTRMGFTAFALEAPWAGSLALNDYVLGGEGDPRALLADGPWTVDTEETLELLHWMRHYNADPKHPRKLHFAGYTNGRPVEAAKGLLDYLGEVDPARVSEVRALIAPLVQQKAYWKDYAKLSPEQKQGLHAGLGALLPYFDENQRSFVARTGEARWRVARQQARALAQVEEEEQPKRGMERPRDGHMAENVQWILAQEGPEGRLVLAGHNGHVTFGDLPARPMGGYLRQRLGERYRALGFAFDQGSFLAIRQQATVPDKRLPREAFTVPPAPEGLLEHVLARAHVPACVVDWRQAPAPLQDWFRVPWLTRSIGAGYHEDDPAYWTVTYPGEEYDALFFVERSTPARALVREVSAP